MARTTRTGSEKNKTGALLMYRVVLNKRKKETRKGVQGFNSDIDKNNGNGSY